MLGLSKFSQKSTQHKTKLSFLFEVHPLERTANPERIQHFKKEIIYECRRVQQRMLSSKPTINWGNECDHYET